VLVSRSGDGPMKLLHDSIGRSSKSMRPTCSALLEGVTGRLPVSSDGLESKSSVIVANGDNDNDNDKGNSSNNNSNNKIDHYDDFRVVLAPVRRRFNMEEPARVAAISSQTSSRNSVTVPKRARQIQEAPRARLVQILLLALSIYLHQPLCVHCKHP
jgi:hypothetical protein